MSAEESLSQAITQYAEEHGAQFNTWVERGMTVDGQSVLQKNILAKYQELKGGWRRKKTGERVFIEDILKSEIIQKENGHPLVKNIGRLSKYVSPWSPRTPEQVAAHSKVMTKVLKEHLKESGYVFTSGEIENKFLQIIAQNFLATDTPTGPRFHKINSSGIASHQNWSFEELGAKFGLSRFIDVDRSQLQRGLMEANLKEQAAKISGAKEGDTAFVETMNMLQKVSKPTVGRVLKTDRLLLETEIQKETDIELGVSEFSTLQDINRARSFAATKFERLNSLDDFKPLFNEIETPQPIQWDI